MAGELSVQDGFILCKQMKKETYLTLVAESLFEHALMDSTTQRRILSNDPVIDVSVSASNSNEIKNTGDVDGVLSAMTWILRTTANEYKHGEYNAKNNGKTLTAEGVAMAATFHAKLDKANCWPLTDASSLSTFGFLVVNNHIPVVPGYPSKGFNPRFVFEKCAKTAFVAVACETAALCAVAAVEGEKYTVGYVFAAFHVHRRLAGTITAPIMVNKIHGDDRLAGEDTSATADLAKLHASLSWFAVSRADKEAKTGVRQKCVAAADLPTKAAAALTTDAVAAVNLAVTGATVLPFRSAPVAVFTSIPLIAPLPASVDEYT